MPEYSQMGMWPGDKYFAKRYDYLSEYVEVLRELWATGKSDLKGEFFQMNDCQVKPQPQADMKIICAGQSDAGLAFPQNMLTTTCFRKRFKHTDSLCRN